MTRRSSSVPGMGRPSLEMATQPASLSSCRGAISSPARPTVAAAMGQRRGPWGWVWAARSSMKRVTLALSLTGLVLAMHMTEPKPPRAAASRPVLMSSLYSKPGSRRWTWASTMLGMRIRPRASTIWLPSGAA